MDWSQPGTWIIAGAAIAAGEAIYGLVAGLLFGPPRCPHCGARHKRPSLFRELRDHDRAPAAPYERD